MKKRGSSSLGKIAVKSGFSDLHAFADLANREAAILVHGFELADACGIQFRFASAVASANRGDFAPERAEPTQSPENHHLKNKTPCPEPCQFSESAQLTSMITESELTSEKRSY